MEQKNPKTNPNKENGKETSSVNKSAENPEKKQVKNLTDFISEEVMPSDVLYSAYEQDRYFGSMNVPPFTDGLFVNERFGYKKRYGCKEKHCTLLLDQKTGATVGILPPLALSKVWDSAHNPKFSKPSSLGFTKERWNEIKSEIEKFIVANPRFNKKSSKKSILVQDVFNLTEKEFEELFLQQGSEVVKLLRQAVSAEIMETANLKKRWFKIKKYAFKVPLESINGGIFTKRDADLLKKQGIYNLNDLRSKSVYYLKTLGLEHSFTYIIEEINTAFKEDARRRWDTRFQVFPYAFGFISTIASIVIGLIFKYTLIKNEPMTIVLLGLLVVWLTLGVLSIVIGVIRARFRRRKRPGYKFFTKPVTGRTVFLSLVSVVAIGAMCLFYLRYDGYDDTVYYRDLDDGNIAVAGLFDEEIQALEIPTSIDGKTVVEIDRASFHKKEIISVTVPQTVKTIDRQAFYECKELKYATMYGAETVGERAFANCDSLERVAFSDGLQSIDKEAFLECKLLYKADLPATAKTIGQKAFYNCNALKELGTPSGVEEIKENAFEKCGFTSVNFSGLKYVRKEAFKACENLLVVYASDSLEQISEKAFVDCTKLEYVYNANNSNGELNGLKRIESHAFANCNISAFTAGEQLEYVGEKAFENCNTIDSAFFGVSVKEFSSNIFSQTKVNNLTVPYIGKTIESSKDYSLDYFGCSSVSSVTLGGSSTVYAKAFSGSLKPTYVYLLGVTTIETGAFKNNTSLRSIYIPQTVTAIADGSFEGCSYLYEITGFEGVKTVGASAFKNCTSLRTINLSAVETIKSNAFESCNLSDIEGLNSIKSIGDGAFINGLSLDSFVYLNDTDNVLSIGANAFFGCDIDSLLINGKVTIGNYAFSQAYLKEVNLSGADIVSFGEGTFANCSYLRAVTLPSGITSIPASMLENVAIEEITLPSTVTKIGNKAFKGTRLNAIVINDGITEIGAEAYAGISNITTVDVPSSVESIGKNAFADISGLTYVRVPFLGTSKTSTNSGYSTVFGNTSNVELLYVTEATSITKTLLDGAGLIDQIVINGSATVVGEESFKDFVSTSITLPSGITAIQKQAFSGCENIEEFTLPSTVKNINDGAFEKCTSIRTITLPDSLESLGASAFKGCTDLTNIVLPEKIDVIASETFSGCSYLATVEVKGELVEVKASAFYGCRNLLSINLSDTVKNIGDKAFYGCNSLSTINIPKSVQTIGESAFENCYYITSIAFADEITQIGKNAFKGCYSITSIVIPENVTKIGEGAFYGCTSLSSVRLSKTFENLVEDIFPEGIAVTFVE